MLFEREPSATTPRLAGRSPPTPTDRNMLDQVSIRLIDVRQALGRLKGKVTRDDSYSIAAAEQAVRVEQAIQACLDAGASDAAPRSVCLDRPTWVSIYEALSTSAEILRKTDVMSSDPLCASASSRLDEFLASLDDASRAAASAHDPGGQSAGARRQPG
jgi:hypothetical protein